MVALLTRGTRASDSTLSLPICQRGARQDRPGEGFAPACQSLGAALPSAGAIMMRAKWIHANRAGNHGRADRHPGDVGRPADGLLARPARRGTGGGGGRHCSLAGPRSRAFAPLAGRSGPVAGGLSSPPSRRRPGLTRRGASGSGSLRSHFLGFPCHGALRAQRCGVGRGEYDHLVDARARRSDPGHVTSRSSAPRPLSLIARARAPEGPRCSGAPDARRALLRARAHPPSQRHAWRSPRDRPARKRAPAPTPASGRWRM